MYVIAQDFMRFVHTVYVVVYGVVYIWECGVIVCVCIINCIRPTHTLLHDDKYAQNITYTCCCFRSFIEWALERVRGREREREQYRCEWEWARNERETRRISRIRITKINNTKTLAALESRRYTEMKIYREQNKWTFCVYHHNWIQIEKHNVDARRRNREK